MVATDSGLGWELTLDYMTDAFYLNGKIAPVHSVLDIKIPVYRKSLEITKVKKGEMTK